MNAEYYKMLAGGEEPSHENGTNFLSKSNFDEVVSIKDFFAPSTSSPNRNVMNIEPVVTPGHWPKGKDMGKYCNIFDKN